MFTGIQLLEPRIFDYIPRGVFSHSVTDVYRPAIANGETLAAHIASGTWRELSTLKRYLDISVELLNESGKAYVTGANTTISESATVTDSILWDDVKVGAGARINRAGSTTSRRGHCRTRSACAHTRRASRSPAAPT